MCSWREGLFKHGNEKEFFLLAIVMTITIISPRCGWCWHGYVFKVLDGDSLRVKKEGKFTKYAFMGLIRLNMDSAMGIRQKDLPKLGPIKKQSP